MTVGYKPCNLGRGIQSYKCKNGFVKFVLQQNMQTNHPSQIGQNLSLFERKTKVTKKSTTGGGRARKQEWSREGERSFKITPSLLWTIKREFVSLMTFKISTSDDVVDDDDVNVIQRNVATLPFKWFSNRNKSCFKTTQRRFGSIIPGHCLSIENG